MKSIRGTLIGVIRVLPIADHAQGHQVGMPFATVPVTVPGAVAAIADIAARLPSDPASVRSGCGLDPR